MPVMEERVLKVGHLFRDFTVKRGDVDTTKRTVALSFSSETEEVERWFGVEILDHSPGAVDLRRLKRSGALLIDHDPTNQVGVIEEVTIGADRKGRALVRFGRSAKAEEIFQDVIDGIRTNVSCGYDPIEMKLDRTQENGPDVYRVTRWMPFEISLVSIPADIEVGVGRGADEQREIRVTVSTTTREEPTMPEEKKETAPEAPAVRAAVIEGEPKTPSAKETEALRKRAIENLCKVNKIDSKQERMWIDSGFSLDQVADDLVDIMEERGKTNPQPLSRVGLTDRETKTFSLTRAIRACAENNWTSAPFELECSRAVAQKLNQVPNPNRFYVPFEVMQRPVEARSQRDLTVATAGAGGYLVSTDNQGFVEMLRNRSVVMNAGARRLSGLTGNVTIPRQSAAGTPYWLLNEATQITESQQTFVQIPLTPKTVGAYTEISRQLLLQSSPGVEGIVTDDLAQIVALAADLGALEGSGASGQPTGISATSGIGSVTGTSLAAAGVIEFQTDVAASNVNPVAGAYVTTPVVAGLLMVRPELPSTGTTRLWQGNIWDGSLFGLRAMTSNQLTAGSMIFGDWNELVIGEWGILEIETNPFANFQAGIIGVRAIYSMDVGVRRPFAFSRATSIT